MDNIQDNKDKWDIALDQQIVILKQCQKKMQLDSCTPCTKVIECEIRKSYVKAVYESMNKGTGGGFEF
jgi:hypothetical protein